MRNSLIPQRVRNILGESELDDGLIKSFIQSLEDEVELLLKETDSREIAFRQGYVAALREAVQRARLNNKRKLIEEEEDESE